jgi:hypothetical protein
MHGTFVITSSVPPPFPPLKLNPLCAHRRQRPLSLLETRKYPHSFFSRAEFEIRFLSPSGRICGVALEAI